MIIQCYLLDMRKKDEEKKKKEITIIVCTFYTL